MKLQKILKIIFVGILLYAGCSLDESTGPEGTKGTTGTSDLKLFINEFMASNDAAVADPEDDGTGDNSPYDDWFEIYNADSIAINIGGMYVSDDSQDPTLWQIPNTDQAKTTIQPGGFLVIWADGESDQGVLHADFSLSGGGEEIVLTESDGQKTIESLVYDPQQTDISYGRNPDGSDNWQTFTAATPGASNSGPQPNQAPAINNVSATPGTVTDSTIVTVSAEVTDADGNITSVVLSYGPEGAIDSTKTMTANGIVYSTDIGPFVDGSIIKYFISATDDSAATTISNTLEIRVGYIPPVLFINEFLASNDSCCTDEYGDYDDWIEIYNPDTIAVDIGGMYITDDLADKMKWQIPTSASDSTTVPPAGFLVLWADGETDQGILHLDIKLSGSGEQIGLTAPNGTTVIDSLTYGSQTTDISYGRMPDGSDNWQTFTIPTPGSPNN